MSKSYANPQGRQSYGVWGREPPDFGQGVVKYYYMYILSCTGSIFESGDF